MASTVKKCGEWTYTTSNPDENAKQTADCTTVSPGCKNPGAADNKCVCDETKGFTMQDNACVCDDSKNLSPINDGAECGCSAGYGKASNSTNCAKCTAGDYKATVGNSTCQPCGTGKVGVPATGVLTDSANGPNTQCFCEKAEEGLFGTDVATAKCIPCSGEGYNTKRDKGHCTCLDGYTQNATTGACEKSSGSSSASPLAILVICSLIISIIASIATAAVMIRRKANNTRAAEAIVSDAL